MLKLFKRKKEYPRKRRIWNHDAEPFYDALMASRVVYAYEIKKAIIKENAPFIPEELYGLEVNILFYGKLKCEVELIDPKTSQLTSLYVPTDALDFSTFIDKPWSNQIQEGEYVRSLKDIYADDETKDELAEEGDELLVIQVHSQHREYPYWLYNESKNTFLRAKEDEFERLYKRIEQEIR